MGTKIRTDKKEIFENAAAERLGPIPNSKRIRKISPLGFRVVVRLEKDSNISEGGLYLPEGARQATEEAAVAKVVEVASAHEDDSDEVTNISGIPLHSTVLIPKSAGIKVPWDDSLRIVDTKEVLAIVDEISLI